MHVFYEITFFLIILNLSTCILSDGHAFLSLMILYWDRRNNNRQDRDLNPDSPAYLFTHMLSDGRNNDILMFPTWI